MIVGTRGSALALHQTNGVITALQQRFPDQEFVIQTVKTLGDRVVDVPLNQFGATGVFVKEIDRLLVEGVIDLAVHSLKDVPPDETPGTLLAAFPERADPRDVLVSRDGRRLDQLHQGDRVGTSSTRRLAQLRAFRPDLTYVEDLRGNVDTRLRKVFAGEYDAIILAAAGLARLGREDAITEYLSIDVCLPDAGQGTLAVQTRSEDRDVTGLVAALDDPRVRAAAIAERSVLRSFGGGCKIPVAAYAEVEDESLLLRGLVAAPNGSRVIREKLTGPLSDPVALGQALWGQLTTRGAEKIVGGEGRG